MKINIFCNIIYFVSKTRFLHELLCEKSISSNLIPGICLYLLKKIRLFLSSKTKIIKNRKNTLKKYNDVILRLK